MKTLHLIAVPVVAVAVAGCGGDSDKKESGGAAPAKQNPAVALRQDAAAKASALELITAVEACYIDQQSYSGCEKPTGTKVAMGSAPGQAEVTSATGTGYTAVAHSRSGNSFKIEKKTGGALTRSCDKPGTGGCGADGKW